jgi:predicted DNA-binding transcriptional regulator AlpA
VAKTITVPDSTDLLPDPQVAARYGINPRTLYRWDEQPTLGFPRPLRINHRKYRRIAELESWERSRVA